jgi:hypothetical protein
MCIFNRRVAKVYGTTILVAPLLGGRQLCVYENNVAVGAKAEPNAMILPLPLGKGEKLVPVDLSKVATFFQQCEQCFEEEEEMKSSSSHRGSNKQDKSKAKLEVIDVGSYKVSLALSLDDLYRIDESVFKVQPDIAELLKVHYGSGFGFAICLFNKTLKAHPIAFISSLLPDGTLFIPTRHEHGDGSQKAHFDHHV